MDVGWWEQAPLYNHLPLGNIVLPKTNIIVRKHTSRTEGAGKAPAPPPYASKSSPLQPLQNNIFFSPGSAEAVGMVHYSYRRMNHTVRQSGRVLGIQDFSEKPEHFR